MLYLLLRGLSVHGVVCVIGDEDAAAVSGSGKLGRDTSKLTVEPLRAVVKTNLTKELILLTSADLCQRLKEKVALAGDRLINGSQNAQVQQQGSTGTDRQRRWA